MDYSASSRRNLDGNRFCEGFGASLAATQGYTVGLAQRMESRAAADTTYSTERTTRLVEGYFALRDLGEFGPKSTTGAVRGKVNRSFSTRRAVRAAALVCLLLAVACSRDEEVAMDGAAEVVSPAEADSEERAAARRAALTRGATDELRLENQPVIGKPLFGDFDDIVERRLLRALVPYSKTYYFLDGGRQRGLAYEALKEFEKELNEQLGTRYLRVNVLIVPVSRDELIKGLIAGHGDVAVGNITITDARRELVDFSEPLMTGVDEVIVTGPDPEGAAPAPPLRTLDDLSGREIVVRASSSYYDSLERLNETLRGEGRAPIRLTLADELLEDEDLLEMVNAGLVPVVVIDKHKATFWSQIFDGLVVHEDLVVRSGGQVAWAFRKNSPQLAKVVNDYSRRNKRGTLLGNMLFNRYLKSTKWAERALSEEGRARFKDTASLFQRYAKEYDFPWLLLTAQAYQESGLDQSMRSRAGAVGVMQLLPSTAADPNVGIADIEVLENNIHAGVKYLRFIKDRYFADAEMTELDKTLFSFAAYNAGPARVARLRGQAQKMGFDPNVWFRNVEVVAAQEIGRETVQYVSNIFKYYVAYRRGFAVTVARER
jgi:membrane-bound lytic murein transglycosylase MltF